MLEAVRTNSLVLRPVLASEAVLGRRERPLAPLVIVVAGLVLSLAMPGAGGAGPSEQTVQLRRQQAGLAARSHTALLGLYSLDSRLAQARSLLASLQRRSAAVRVEQAQVAREEEIAETAWRVSVRALGSELLRRYEQGEPSTGSVLLGATSVGDAVDRLDTLQRSARAERETIEQARSAQETLARTRSVLAARAAELQRLVAQAGATTAELTSARAQRVAYLASLQRQQHLKAAAIARLAASARQIVTRSQVVSAGRGTDPAAGAAGGRTAAGSTLTVTATGYSGAGHTSTGMPAVWGVVSVDPSVIPLGTRMTIPGYGDGVAADTGSGIQGAMVDLWFPTPAQALAWGRRTLTITLH
jgi:3D (Asp-Asp-Asp) domain-containing protein/arsenate reductase-like glutaredoxin family protein